jgi:hydrogenase maturation factor
VCLGEYGVVVDLTDTGRAVVHFHDGSRRTVSLAVLVADGVEVRPGDVVMVSIGMALERVEPEVHDLDLRQLTEEVHR